MATQCNGIEGMFRALSDRTRLRILRLLAEEELCVCQIVESLRIRQAMGSRHLAYLKRAGLVHVRREGLRRFYRLAPATDPFHVTLIACLDAGCAQLADCTGKIGARRVHPDALLNGGRS